jgi:hypothetical protein
MRIVISIRSSSTSAFAPRDAWQRKPFAVTPPDVSAVQIDGQHSDYRWMHERELLACDQVHANTKVYFSPAEAVRHDEAPPST